MRSLDSLLHPPLDAKYFDENGRSGLVTFCGTQFELQYQYTSMDMTMLMFGNGRQRATSTNSACQMNSCDLVTFPGFLQHSIVAYQEDGLPRRPLHEIIGPGFVKFVESVLVVD